MHRAGLNDFLEPMEVDWVAKRITASLFDKDLLTRPQTISEPITSSSFISGHIVSNFVRLIKIPPQVLIMPV